MDPFRIEIVAERFSTNGKLYETKREGPRTTAESKHVRVANLTTAGVISLCDGVGRYGSQDQLRNRVALGRLWFRSENTS